MTKTTQDGEGNNKGVTLKSLEQRLWEAVDALRGNQELGEYKHVPEAANAIARELPEVEDASWDSRRRSMS